MTTNALTIDINNPVSVASFETMTFDMKFRALSTAQDVLDEIAFGDVMDKMSAANAEHAAKLVYVDIARIVHLIEQVANGNSDVVQAFNQECANRGMTAPKQDANPYRRHIDLLQGRFDANKNWIVDGKWRNLARAVRWLVENKVRPVDVPKTIEQAVAKDSNGQTLTRLLALTELDRKAHPSSKTSAANPFGSAAAQKAISELPAVTTISMPIELNYNSEGYALAVVRKAANGAAEVLYDAGLEAKTIMKGVRDGYDAIK